jgi:hypothetical protein
MKVKSIAVAVLAVGLLVALAGLSLAANLQQAQSIVLDKVLGGDLAGKRVYALANPVTPEAMVKSWRKQYEIPYAQAWFFHIDDYPQANWEHATRYVFVDCGTGAYRVFDATTPPEIYMRGERRFVEEIAASRNQPPIVNPMSLKGARSEQGRSSTFSQADELFRNTAPEHLWAVVLDGGYDRYSNYTRYWNDLSNIYTTLTKKYGYLDSHILVSCSDGTDPAPDRSNNTSSPLDLDHDGDNDIEYSSTYASLESILLGLQAQLTPDDLFFFYATDHGGQEQGNIACMWLWNHDRIIDTTFARLTGPIQSRHKIYCLEPCFSGGFIDNLNREGEVVAAACDWDEYSWACDTEGDFDEFVYHWNGAVRGCYPYSASEPWRDGTPVDADINNDNRISMQEAFDYALDHDSRPEAPQYLSTPSYLGQLVTLGDIPPLTNLTITLVPDTYPVIIPPQGGSFGFTATVQNQAAIPQTMHGWTQADVPGRGTVPALGPRLLTLTPGATRSDHFIQNVPAGALPGTYNYCGVLGIFGESEAFLDCFDVVKQ